MSESIKNAQINHGADDFYLLENNLEVVEKEQKTTLLQQQGLGGFVLEDSQRNRRKKT